MINSFSCINVFSKNTKELIHFYHEILEIPILNTLVDETDGVNLGFIHDAPTICIWDANKWEPPVHGTVSFVFRCDNLDQTCEELTKKGIAYTPPVKFDWGTYELRLTDPDGNEAVVAEVL